MRTNFYSEILLFALMMQISCSILAQSSNSISGILRDKSDGQALAYATIYVKYSNFGTISNENGEFHLHWTPSANDTIVFQSLGYKTFEMAAPKTDTFINLSLAEEVFKLNELLVYAKAPDPYFIIQKILENKSLNYPKRTNQSSFFIRSRDHYKIKEFKPEFIKSDINSINQELIRTIEKTFPKEILSYTDVAGTLYRTGNPKDSVNQKVVASKAVSLDDQDLSSSLDIINKFNEIQTIRSKDEYWELKSGIFRTKLDELKQDSVKSKSEELESQTIRNLRYTFKTQMAFANFEDEKEWDFLYNPDKYLFTIAGGVFINKEEAYIIDFQPKKTAKYKGRLYVSAKSYALIKADFKLAVPEEMSDRNIFGVALNDDSFSASIYFEKADAGYQLKYLSKAVGQTFRFNREVELKKRKERWLFDKTLESIKIDLRITNASIESTELLLSDTHPISSDDYRNVQENKKLDLQLIKHFDDSIWKDYSIIEPTRQMKEYSIPEN